MSFTKLAILLAASTWQDTAASTLDIPTLELPPVRERGLAAWYGDGAMHGRYTATGEAIDPGAFTCAHRTIPLNTTVMLVNGRDPGLRVWCRINDRGPYGALLPDGKYAVKTAASQPGRWRGVIDVSVSAATMLGTYGKGLEPIEIRAHRVVRPRKRK